MMQDTDIGFEGDERVPTVDFDYPETDTAEPPEAQIAEFVGGILEMLGADLDAQEAGRNLLLLGHVFGVRGFPKNQRELAERSELSVGCVNKKLRVFRAKLKDLPKK